MEDRVRTCAAAALAATLVVAGLVSVRDLSSDVPAGSGPARDAAVLPYLATLSLLTAALMVLTGLLLERRRPALGTATLVVGAVLGVAAGLDTVVVPVLVVVVVVLTLRRQAHVRG